MSKEGGMNITGSEERWLEDFHANAVELGALVTRNRCQNSELLVRRLSRKDHALLSKRLGELRQQFHREILEHIRQLFLEERTLSSQLTTFGARHLMSLLSESLGRQVCRLSLGDVSPEVLHIWLEACTASSSPNASENTTSDSTSETAEETVAQDTQTERPAYETFSEHVRRRVR